MGWWEFIPEVLTALGVVFVPGFLVALAARRPPAVAALLAPMLTFALVSASAIVLSLVGVPWNLVSFGLVACGVAVITAVIATILSRTLPPRSSAQEARRARPAAAWGVVGAALGAVLLAVQLASIFGSPEAISQSYDNIFHLNAVRRIAESGDASSLTLNSLATGERGLSFYPAGWHGGVSLLFSVFGTSVPAAMNATTIAVAALAWPLSMAYLSSVIWPDRRSTAAAVGALSAVFLAFPGLMLKWGVLYPNMLSYAILPVLLAFILLWVRAVMRASVLTICARTAAVAVAAAAVGLAHPNGLTSAAALALPLLVLTLWDAVRSKSRERGSVLRASGIASALLACLAIWAVVRPSATSSTWPPKLPSGQAAGEFLTNSFDGNIAAVSLSALVLVGAIVCVRQRESRWLVVSWALVGALWVVVASLSPGTLRWLLTGPWYNDSFRLAALTAIPSALLAAVGLVAAATALTSALARGAAGAGTQRTRRWSVAVAGVVVVALCFTPSARGASAAVAREFRETPDSLLITEDEQNVLDHVAEIVAPDEVIAVNPWDGSAVAYALADRQVTQFHTLGATAPRFAAIPEGLNEADRDSEACEQVRDENVRWYLRFDDTLGIGAWALPFFEGFEGVVETGAVRPAFVSGNVGLYEIVGCQL